MDEKLISKAEAVNEIRKSMGGFFSLTFIKKDGSVRRMNCRMGVKSYRKHNAPPIPPTVWHLPKYITTFDVTKKDYRNVNVNTIQSLRIGGNRYLVA